MKRLTLALSSLFLLTMATTSLLFAETEPNNALGEATEISINTQTAGTLGQPGDLDWYKVSLTTPGRLRLSVTNPPSNIRIRIELYNRHGEYTYAANTAINGGDYVYLSYDVFEVGTYFIRVNEADGKTSTSTYTLSAEFTPVTDAQEPNNDPGRAFLINSASVTGKIFPGGDEDWFKIYVESGNKLQLTVASPAEMVARLELYNPSFGYMYVSGQAINPGDTLHLDHTALVSGMYYVRLTDARGFAHVQPYTLSITGGTPGYLPLQNPVTAEAESNNELGLSNLIALSTTVSGAIQAAADDDWYRLNIPNAGQLKVDVTQAPSNLRLRANLYNRSGGYLLSAQSSDPGTPFSMIFDIPAADTYYLMMEAVDGAASATGYVFSTALTEVTDAYEPNNNYGDAKALVQQNRIEAYIFPVGDQDWYKIEISQPGDVQIILSNVPKNIIPEINFYNLSKSYLAGKSGIAGDDLVLVHRVSAAGSYFVQISDGGNNDESTAPYTLTIFGGNFISYAPIAKIDAITPGSTVVGESVQFSGSGTDQDGVIQGYNWRSNMDGNLSTQAAFSTSALSIGTHTIYFKVQDNSGLWSTEKNEVVYVGTGVSTETEANSPIGNADEITLNHPVTAKISPQWDEDFFKVYVDRPGRLDFSATNVPANLRLAIELYNQNLDYLWTRSAGVVDGDTVSVSYNVTDTGWYYIRVIDSDGDVNADYTYTLNATLVPAVDPQEPNNQMLDAYLLTTPTVDAYLFPNGDLDWYRVWADAGQNLKVDLTDIPANLRLRLEFYDRDRRYTWVAKEASNKGDLVSLTYLVEKAGFVYIRVNDADGDLNWTQKYRMTVTGANIGYILPETPMTAEREVNNEIADANLVGSNVPISATIGTQWDEDWFKFEMGTAGVILAKLTDVPSDLRMRIRIFQSDGGQINYGEATNAGDSLMLDTRVTKPGTYFVLTDSPDGKYNAGAPYRLTVSALPASDAYEPNNRFGDATVLKGQNKIQAMIFDRGDEDWYRVTADAGAALTVTVADVPAQIRPLIEIYNRHRNYLTSKAASNNGQTLSLAYSVTETADYWIRIADVGGDSFAPTPYTLIITGARFTSFTPLALIDSVSPNPVPAGQPVTLTGHGEDTGGSIIGYAWRSSRDGEISQSQIAELNNLSTGVHTLYFKVKDNDQNWSPETSTILYVGVSAPGEQEPNNEIGAANPIVLDTPFSGTIDPANDLDFYRIEITQPVRLTINATNPTGTTMRTRLEMYSPNADYAWQAVEAQNTGDPMTLNWDINTVGTYYLRVNDSNGNAGNQYTLTVHLQAAADAYEPNDDVTHAAPIALQDNILAYVFPGGNLDWYEVTTDKPGRLTVSLTNVPADLKGRIEIYDRNLNYTWVAAQANNDGDNVFVDYDISAPGTYFIRINDIDGHANAEATYRLATQFKPAPDMFEPNGDFHQAKLLTMSPVEAYLFPSGDYDFYKFYADAGAAIQVKADNMPANLRLQLLLFDGNNGYLNFSKDATAAGRPVSMDYSVTESGYYFVRVNALDGTYSADAPYRLSLTGAKLDYSPSNQVQLTENEPNGAFGSATQIGIGTQAVTGSFASANDSDWFRFEVTQPGRLTISLTVPSLITSGIRLSDANGTELASRYAENRGDASQLVFDVNKPGTWYLLIHAKDGVTSPDNYQLSLSLNPAADPFEPNADYSEAKLLPFAQPVQPFIFPVGDRDWFKIKTEEPGLIRFMVENVPQNIKMGLTLYNENKETLLTKDILNAGDPIEAVYLAPIAGTYYFQVYDRENNRDSTDPYKLTVFFTPMVDSAEPNNSFGYPTILEASNQVTGLIYPNGDYDWYRFFVKDIGTLRIQMAHTNGIEAHIRLYTDSKQEIAGKVAKNKADTVELTYQITKPDFYYLAVNDEGDDDHSLEPYMLTIAGADFKKFYPLASIQSISPNPSILGMRVTLTGTGTEQGGGAIAGYEWSSDKDGVIGRTAAIDPTDLSAGTHRIGFKVQDQQGNWSATVYRHLMIAGSIIKESEYNNTFASANPVPLRQWVQGRIYPQGDVDHYKIYVNRSGNLSARLAAVPDGMKGRIEFYNDKGDYLWRADGAINPGDWIDYHFFVDQGWYYARITDQNGQSYTDTYAVFFDLLAAPDRYEPNNSFSQATQITLNSSVADGFIGKEGDLDWYQVNIQQKGCLSLSLKHAEMRGRIEIYNADYGYLWVANEAYHGGDNVFLNFDADVPGIYYIRINDANGKAYTTPYTFENTFTPVTDIYEENDSIGAAKLLPVSGVADAFVFPAGDLDWFKIYATAGQQLSLSVTNVPPEMQAVIEIYNQNLDYAWIRESGNNPGDAVYLTYTVPKDGFTYLRINDERGLSYVNSYRLTVSGGSPGYEPSFNPSSTHQEIEPNSDSGIATDIPLDTTFTGKIDPANDYDWYRFYINSPGIVTISHTNISGGVISEMWIYNADKSQIGYRTTTNPDESNVLELPLTKAGYYFVRLADRGQDNVSTSEYSLRITHTPVVDAGEPNNNNGTATRLGQNTIQGYIFDPADQDWYRVYVRQPGNLVVSLDGMPANIRPHVVLYNADKTWAGEWLATNAGQIGDSLITHNVTKPGFYFVQVYHEGSDSYSANPYTLRITGADFSHAPLLDPIGNRTLDETIPYGFTVHATDPVSEIGLVYSASNLPSGAAFDPQTRTFSWTPARGQAGTYPGVQFTVSDGTYQDSQVITITVQELKRPPLLSPIGNKTAFAGLDLTFTGTAADPDTGAVLTYSASNLPSGAVFTPATATFHWTPTISQIGLFKNIKFEVTDGTWTDFAYIDIEVRLADLRGDINGDKAVNLADAILGLQILSGFTVNQSINRGADVNGDGMISMPEVIYILQYLSGLQSAVIYESLIKDHFDTLNTANWWLTRGSNNDYFGEGKPFDASGVTIANGIATLNADITDQVGVMYSKPLAVTKGDILTIKRRAYVHPANREYGGTLSVYEVADPALSASKTNSFAPLFGLMYYNFDYRTDLNLFSLIWAGNYPKGPGDYSAGTAPQIAPLWDQWFEEEFIYNTGTGDTVYKINGVEKMRVQASPLSQPYIKIMMHSYGWYTGHYMQMDYMTVETKRP